MGDLGTFRSASGDLIRCRVDQSGRLSASREAGDKLLPCEVQALFGAVKLSDDPDWLSDPPFVAAGTLVD